jgi:hypothetical protein
MPIDIEFERLPDATMAGPSTCPPERTASWLRVKLEAAETEASEKGGQVVGFVIKKADVKVTDEKLGTVVAPKDHLFIAVSYPEEQAS